MTTKEYRVFEEDMYGNRWFETSFAGNPEIQKYNAEKYVKENERDDFKLVIVEV